MQITFNLPAMYETDGNCTKIEKVTEQISYNETMICKEITGKECYNSYATDFTPVQVRTNI